MFSTLITIIRTAIKHKRLSILPEELEGLSIPVEGLSGPDNSTGFYQIDTRQTAFVPAVIQIIEADLQQSFPLNIADAIVTTEQYEDWLKQNNADNTFRAYDFLLKPFLTGLLIKLSREGIQDIISFYHSLSDADADQIWRFEEYFFDALKRMEPPEEMLLRILLEENNPSKKQRMQHEKTIFVRQLPLTQFQKSVSLYKYGKEHGLTTDIHLTAMLLAGLHDAGYSESVGEAEAFFNDYPSITVVFYGAISKRTPTIIDRIIELGAIVDKSNIELLDQYVFTLEKVLRGNGNEEQRKRIFGLYGDLFALQQEPITNGLVNSLSWSMKGMESERFELMFAAFTSGQIKTKHFKQLFQNFSDPTFFFELFEFVCRATKGSPNLKWAKDSFEHFITKHQAPTERFILHYLSHDIAYLRRNAVQLWIHSRARRNQMDLTQMPDELSQLRALEALYQFPFGFDDLLPSMLLLRTSAFPNVIKYLQHRLSILVFEAYHAHAFKLIEAGVPNDAAGRRFLKPIKAIFNQYERMKSYKAEHKDLDPWANEKSFVQLYYKLESEQQAKSMNEIHNDKNSFFGDVHSVQIVRGNAWKIEGREVTALGRYENSVALDMRMYKNPDHYEMGLQSIKSEF